jgi:hypothetical protein
MIGLPQPIENDLTLEILTISALRTRARATLRRFILAEYALAITQEVLDKATQGDRKTKAIELIDLAAVC